MWLLLFCCGCAAVHWAVTKSIAHHPKSSRHCCGKFILVRCVIAFTYIYILFPQKKNRWNVNWTRGIGRRVPPGWACKYSHVTIWCYLEMMLPWNEEGHVGKARPDKTEHVSRDAFQLKMCLFSPRGTWESCVFSIFPRSGFKFLQPLDVWIVSGLRWMRLCFCEQTWVKQQK